MLSFDEIEDCFPEGSYCDKVTGKTLVSAQWLHDFAHCVAAKEREECAKLAEAHFIYGHSIAGPHFAAVLADKIRERSNVK